MSVPSTLSENVARLRKARNLSQEELAEVAAPESRCGAGSNAQNARRSGQRPWNAWPGRRGAARGLARRRAHSCGGDCGRRGQPPSSDRLGGESWAWSSSRTGTICRRWARRRRSVARRGSTTWPAGRRNCGVLPPLLTDYAGSRIRRPATRRPWASGCRAVGPARCRAGGPTGAARSRLEQRRAGRIGGAPVGRGRDRSAVSFATWRGLVRHGRVDGASASPSRGRDGRAGCWTSRRQAGVFGNLSFNAASAAAPAGGGDQARDYLAIVARQRCGTGTITPARPAIFGRRAVGLETVDLAYGSAIRNGRCASPDGFRDRGQAPAGLGSRDRLTWREPRPIYGATRTRSPTWTRHARPRRPGPLSNRSPSRP